MRAPQAARRAAALTIVAIVFTGCGAGATPTGAPTPSPSALDPYARLAAVPALTVSSTSVRDQQPFALSQMSAIFGVPGGKDESPKVDWTSGPAGTKSYVVTMYDPDAPTGSGFWHWVVYDIPASVHHLSAGAGNPNSKMLPAGAVQGANDAGLRRYLGAAPPKSDAAHHYYLTITAIDVARLPVTVGASPALVGFTLRGHTLARGHLVATARVS